MQRRMVFHLRKAFIECISNEGQLTKDDEASTGGEDIEVRREDQEKINKFSTLHQKETGLEQELKNKQVRRPIFTGDAPANCVSIEGKGGLGRDLHRTGARQ